ncbi:ATP-binding protein [candidate division KSB1 bacterium]|nr:ATP-binding protein [candidate division KSB1 bacterium]RQW04751.1 MAG: ATP-binding protein [candidate division KSB1 bacterium]
MIRDTEISNLTRLFEIFKVVAIVGARQVGKTTLAQQFLEHSQKTVSFFDLENPEDITRLADPMLTLKKLKGIVVLDEIQRLPDLFRILRVLADRPKTPARFLVLGSASPNLLRQSSETLAGRITYQELGGFSINEVGLENLEKLWLRGGFPLSFLARTHANSEAWRKSFIKSFIERDMPQLGFTINSTTLRRFWSMLAHYHGQIWNASDIGRSFGLAHTTVRSYLDALTSALVVRQLQPWFENISKRQVKAPKVYITDSGLMHTLLNVRTMADLEGHPKVGASWEGFVIEQLIRHLGVEYSECYFWATHAGAELDLFIPRGRKRYGFEIKRTTAPRLTPSMRSAMDTLKLTRLDVIHMGEHIFPLAEKVRAVPFLQMLETIQPFR